MEFCVAKVCTVLGTYPVNSNTKPIANAVKAAVNFTINVELLRHTRRNQQHLQGKQ